MSMRLVGQARPKTMYPLSNERRRVTGVVRLPRSRRRAVPAVLYDTALTSLAYGQTPVQMGDLFNDIMGAVIPGWDQRPDDLKKIQLKVDPAKIIQATAKVVPPSTVAKGVALANQNGVNLFYRTPAGNVEVTPGLLQSAYSNYPMFSSAMSGLQSIPWWVYALGGGVLLMLLMPKGK